jgi:hypothetical protein
VCDGGLRPGTWRREPRRVEEVRASPNHQSISLLTIYLIIKCDTNTKEEEGYHL